MWNSGDVECSGCLPAYGMLIYKMPNIESGQTSRNPWISGKESDRRPLY